MTGLYKVPSLSIGNSVMGSIGNVDGSIGVGEGKSTDGVVVDTGTPSAGLNGTKVVGSMGKPVALSIASGSPVDGLYRMPLLPMGNLVIGSIGSVNVSMGVGAGVGTGTISVVGDTGNPFAGLNGTDVTGSMGKPVTLSIANGRPVVGLYKVPLLPIGNFVIGSIGSAETSMGVGEARGGVFGDTGILFAGLNGTSVLGLIGKPVTLSIARG